MTTKNQWSSRALAVAAAFMVSACADPTTASIRPLESTPLKAVGDAVDNVLRVEVLKVCKVWVGQAATDVNATLSNAAFANHLASFSIPASTGQCRSVAEDLGADAEHDHSVTEAAQAVGVTTTWTIDSNDNADDASGSGLVSGNVTMGGFAAPGTPRGAVITFTNTFTPPPSTGCTYTKGWYRNNGSSTVIAVDGRSIAEAQAIFNATPGQPGSVTFGGNNTLLNLYQQFLAALNNLGGDANEDLGPAAVDAAIDAVQAGTGGTGFAITTTLTQTQMSALIETLSDFNEGTFAGWPHCDD